MEEDEKKGDWGTTVERRVEKSRGFRASLVSPFLSVFGIYARPTGNRPERCVPSETGLRDQRVTEGKRLFQFDRDKS